MKIAHMQQCGLISWSATSQQAGGRAHPRRIAAVRVRLIKTPPAAATPSDPARTTVPSPLPHNAALVAERLTAPTPAARR